VQRFNRFGFMPDYECDLIDLHPGAVCLRHPPREAAGEAVAAVEIAFARFNRQLGVLRRTLEIRGSELEGAQRHIAALEQKLLKLKEYRRELEVFQQAGGFDPNVSGSLADVDFCLKIRRAGYLIVYTPFAKLYWHDAPPENVDTCGETIMAQRWAGVLQGDPY
jgi:hypothetical protein